MNEQIANVIPVLFVAVIIWVTGLSVFVYLIYARFNALGKGVKAGSLTKILDEVLGIQKKNVEQIDLLGKELGKTQKDMVSHIQKVGFVRYNPFNETGGDQSFSLCLLDKMGNGFMISCLHTRDRSRVYAKPVEFGKTKYKLSDEEVKAFKEALK